MAEPINTMRLRMLGLPAIDNLQELSTEIHLSISALYKLSKYSSYYYKTYTIPKKSGGSRTIAQPAYELKSVQSWILRNILEGLKVSSSCKGFEKNMNIRNNAEPHVGANIVINLDIENFFPSIRASWVYNIFRTLGYNRLMSTIFTSLCTYQNSLPQGGAMLTKTV